MVIHISLDLETWGTEPGCDLRSIGACVFNPLTGDVSIPCQTCKGGTVAGNIDSMSGDCSDCLNTRMTNGYGDTFYVATDNPSSDPNHPVANLRGNAWHWDGVDAFRKYPLKRDPRTVQWWSEQSDEAQAAFANPVDLREALGNLTHWIASIALPAPKGDRRFAVFPFENIRLWSHGPAFDPPILAAAYKAVGLPVPWHYRTLRDTRTCFDLAGIDDHSAWLDAHPGPLGVPHHALDDAICQARAVCAAMRRIRLDAPPVGE